METAVRLAQHVTACANLPAKPLANCITLTCSVIAEAMLRAVGLGCRLRVSAFLVEQRAAITTCSPALGSAVKEQRRAEGDDQPPRAAAPPPAASAATTALDVPRPSHSLLRRTLETALEAMHRWVHLRDDKGWAAKVRGHSRPCAAAAPLQVALPVVALPVHNMRRPLGLQCPSGWHSWWAAFGGWVPTR